MSIDMSEYIHCDFDGRLNELGHSEISICDNPRQTTEAAQKRKAPQRRLCGGRLTRIGDGDGMMTDNPLLEALRARLV
jgi:hypothetical protein